MPRKIEVVPYDAAWPAYYAQWAAVLQQVLGPVAIALHHIGSTAIPGLSAKPTIDVLGEVTALDAVDALNDALRAVGFEPRGENGTPGRRYFVRFAADGVNHAAHVHLFVSGHPEIQRHLLFRDYLRAHPTEAQLYERLKLALAAQFPFDPMQYTDGKTALVQALDERAAAWQNSLRNAP